MTLKRTGRIVSVDLQDVIDEFLSGESLLVADIAAVQNDSSFVVMVTTPQGVDNDIYTYSVSKSDFVTDFLVAVVPGVTREEVVNVALNGNNIDVSIDFSSIEEL